MTAAAWRRGLLRAAGGMVLLLPVGVLVAGAGATTADDWQFQLGVALLLLGGLGAVVCIAAAMNAALAGTAVWARVRHAAIALLLAAGLVGAGVVAAQATMVWYCRFVVSVHNASGRDVRSVRLVGGGTEYAFGDLVADGRDRCVVWFARDDELALEFDYGGTQRRELVEGYVTQCLGGAADVAVGRDGRLVIAHGR